MQRFSGESCRLRPFVSVPKRALLPVYHHAAHPNPNACESLAEKVQRILFRRCPSQFDLELKQRQTAGNLELPTRANYLLVVSIFGDFQEIYWPVLSKLALAAGNRTRSSMELWPLIIQLFVFWVVACSVQTRQIPCLKLSTKRYNGGSRKPLYSHHSREDHEELPRFEEPQGIAARPFANHPLHAPSTTQAYLER